MIFELLKKYWIQIPAIYINEVYPSINILLNKI